MKKEGYYSSGQFAKLAHVSVRTIRFYDKQNILKPSLVENGVRFYTQKDLGRLQQILLLKYLGFALDDIRELTIDDNDYRILRNQLNLQLTLIQDKIEQMQLVQHAIEDTTQAIDQQKEIDWSQMLELIELTSMESSLKTQYQNSNNITSRIRLHGLFSTNKQGWFPWLFEQGQLQAGMNILELGCGNGSLWLENSQMLPDDLHILLTDSSEGMIRDARRSIKSTYSKEKASAFRFQVMPCEKLTSLNQQYDVIIANHLLFYLDDIPKVISEIHRHLKTGGRFVCSTYGMNHMREIRELVKEFDQRISLSGEVLYERFGLQNGKDLLLSSFEEKSIEMRIYPDQLLITKPEPLVEYILSCHGNQNQYLLERYKDFRSFIEQKTKNGLTITKEAGIFICTKVPN